jgi:hypothetical protein
VACSPYSRPGHATAMNRFVRAWLELCGTPAGESDRLAHWREQWALDKRLADDTIESMEQRYAQVNQQSLDWCNAATIAQKHALELDASLKRMTDMAERAIAERDAAHVLLQQTSLRVDKLVDHLVDLKREGFSPSSAAPPVAPAADLFPASIEHALNMRNFDDRIDRMNRQYALDQLRERPDDADQIALEIIRGELQDSPEGTEPIEVPIAAD